MSGSFSYIDIILFAAVALFAIFRLGGVLGKKTGHQSRPSEKPNLFDTSSSKDKKETSHAEANIISISESNTDSTNESNDVNKTVKEANTPLTEKFLEIQKKDSDFDANMFLTGACAAFELILSAYAKGDEETLKTLLSEEVFIDFSTAIRTRINDGLTLEETLIGIDNAEIIEAWLDNITAFVTVKFISQQTYASYDVDGKLVDGDPNQMSTVTDIWTFKRDTQSKNPNWFLSETRNSNYKEL